MNIYDHPLTRVQDELKDTFPESPNATLVDRIEGNLIYLVGHTYPLKGIPTPEAIHAVNIVKTMIRETFFRLSVRRTLKSFNNVAWKVISPYVVKEEYMTSAALTIQKLIQAFLEELVPFGMVTITAKTIAHIFEYDSAYRFRVQDLASETTVDKLLCSPTKEIRRLMMLNRERDFKILPLRKDGSRELHKVTVSDKFWWASLALRVLLIRRKYRRAFKIAVRKVGIKDMQFDENDVYWACHKTDYNYMGLSLDTRQKLVENNNTDSLLFSYVRV